MIIKHMTNEITRRRQMSETLFLGALLAITGGFLDAYTYLSRGAVFANAQTGNVVLLGLGIARGQWNLILHYSFPILAFILGVLLAELVRIHCKDNRRYLMHWRQIILLIEILVILAVCLIPSGSWDNWVNVAISFVCSMQVESFRSIHGNSYATTMCTGNLRSATDHLFRFLQTGNRESGRISIIYYTIILFFLLGAILGVWFTSLLHGYAALICCGILMVVFLAMHEEGKALKQ